MESIDPATGQPLPADAIQRVLFIVGTVHVYNIPPMTPGKGHVAALVSSICGGSPISSSQWLSLLLFSSTLPDVVGVCWCLLPRGVWFSHPLRLGIPPLENKITIEQTKAIVH